jgi:hypothetical protein
LFSLFQNFKVPMVVDDIHIIYAFHSSERERHRERERQQSLSFSQKTI